jgi:putative ABC transport system permease protein
MSALDRKLFRDLWLMRGQAVAIALVIASGVATLVMSLSTLDSLTRSRDAYYDRYRFADVFAQVKRAPVSVADRLAELPGVARVQTRIVREVSLDVPGLAEPAVGRLISTPESGPPLMNAWHLRRGRPIAPGRPGEVLASEAFASAHGFQPGDALTAIINGRRQTLRIAGIALSPEYILQVRGAGAWPDDQRFGVFWMNRRELEAAFDMRGAFNDVTLTLLPGASESEVIRQTDRLLAPYGGTGAYGRHEQISHRFLTEEIRGLRGMIVVIPVIFFAVAAFLLNVVLSRMIAIQRGEIGALKAFGYTGRELGLHYLKLAMLVVVAGSALGTAVGARLGRGLTALYARFYRFPEHQFSIEAGLMLLGLLVSAAAAALGVVAAARRAAALPPAEAMRPEPPSHYRPTSIERWGLQRWMSQPARMILRNLERRPFKAALSVFGMSLAVAILVVGSFQEDALRYMMDFQFRQTQRENVSIAFAEPLASGALHELRRLPGVWRVEAFRHLPVVLRAGHRHRRIGIMGVENDAELSRLLDASGATVRLPPDGLVLSDKLAETLAVRPGDLVTVEVLDGQRPVRQARVMGLVAQYSGLGAYMQRPALNRLAREGDNVSGAHLGVDAHQQQRLYRTLKNTPGVASVTVKEAALQSFNDTVAENLLQMRIFNILFACVIAFGVVYNSARISLSERSRELATLRVIGFRRAEISMILLGELAVLVLAAIPAGFALGYALAAWVTLAFDTEVYRIPLVIERHTYGFAAAVTLLAALLSGLAVRRKLDHLDLVAVLKARE